MEDIKDITGSKTKREKFMQGWGFILIVVVAVIGALIALKIALN